MKNGEKKIRSLVRSDRDECGYFSGGLPTHLMMFIFTGNGFDVTSTCSEGGVEVSVAFLGLLCIFQGVRQDSLILDICSAPGSKTSQLLEMLNECPRPDASKPPEGSEEGYLAHAEDFCSSSGGKYAC